MTKYNVTVNGVSFFTSAAAIKRGVGFDVSVNTVVRQLFEMMFNATGVHSTMSVYDNKMRRVEYDVTIQKV